jgi:hypothetical protein
MVQRTIDEQFKNYSAFDIDGRKGADGLTLRDRLLKAPRTHTDHNPVLITLPSMLLPCAISCLNLCFFRFDVGVPVCDL